MNGKRLIAIAVTVLVFLPGLASAGGVSVRFDFSSTAGSPYPNNRFTVDDHAQETGLRVDLPKPDCSVRPSDCDDLDVINTLDGFNMQPRLSIPFSGPIDVSTANSRTVFLVRLGHGPGREVVGINQVVWDPATNTLHAESDELLDQHTSYLLVVTTAVRDAEGDPIEPGAFEDFLESGRHHADELAGYRRELWNALERAHVRGRIAAASVFTTLSATAVLEKIRREIKSWEPLPATMRGTFPLASLTAIPVVAPDGNGAELHGVVPTASGAFGLPWLGERDRLRQLRVTRLGDAREVHSADRDPHRRTSGATDQRALFQSVHPLRDRAGRRLAGRDLRARLHGQQAGRAVRGRLHLRRPRNRDERDQRRRPRRRRGRPPDRAARRGPARRDSRRRARHRS